MRQTIGLGFLITLPRRLAAGLRDAMGLVALVSSWIALRALNGGCQRLLKGEAK